MQKLLIAMTIAGLASAAEIAPAKRGKLLFEDEFNGAALAKTWKMPKGKWALAGGHLQGTEIAEDKHAAVVRHDVAFRDAVIEVKFQLAANAKMTALSLNSAKGHSCRVTIRPDQLIVQKDKANAKSADKAEVIARQAMTFTPGKWYTLTMELRGNKMTARIDNGPAIGGTNDALLIDRTNIGLPVSGEAKFDSIRVWAAE